MTLTSRPRITTHLPLPGTPEARAQGCLCPVAEDPAHREDGLVIYFGNCPVHAPVVDRLVQKRVAGAARKTA
jgi:hypothetical protein